MANDLQIIGKVAPTYKGVWSASAAYERLDIVANAEKTLAYIARKAVPVGTTLTNTAYWAVILDVSDVLNTVKGAAAELDKKLSDRSTDEERMTNGHFYRIVPDSEHEMVRYTETDGVISAASAISGSGFIVCPRHLCLDFADTNSRCYLYFYDLVDGEYVPRWDILSTTTGSGLKNYMNPSSVATHMIDIPEGVYMQIAVSVGSVLFYGWDGETFGLPLSAGATIPLTNGATATLPENGSSGLTIPGSAKYVCCNSSAIFAIYGYKDGVFEEMNVATRRFWIPPQGYSFFRARLYFGTESPYSAITRTGDVSDLVVCAADMSSELPSARARKVIDACKIVSGLKWTPQKDIHVKNNEGATYKTGVEYNGVPYSSQWTSAHWVGWHVSPYTFVNAVSDIDSVMYNEVAEAWTTTGPYYGIVCSSFATLCDGWPYPQTNAGYIYDPLVVTHYTAEPPRGAVYSDLYEHCMIPERIDHTGGVNVVSVYEAARPTCGKRTRYSNIDYDADNSAYNETYLDGYMDRYGYAVHHIKASGTLDAIPYADFSDVAINICAAVPYKGDRCVHTSEDANVYINIRDDAATELILIAPDGTVSTISASAGRVDVRSLLDQDGIYTVRTDADTVEATFEYHNVEPIEYTLTNSIISFSRNDFWYASCSLRGDVLFEGVETCSVPCSADGDYSAWSSGGRYVSKANCVFYKGQYGAYAVTAITAE